MDPILLEFCVYLKCLNYKLCTCRTQHVMHIFLCRPDPSRLILTFGANVNARDRVNGNTALHWACTSANHAVTKLLLDAGTDLTLLNAHVSMHQICCDASDKM